MLASINEITGAMKRVFDSFACTPPSESTLMGAVPLPSAAARVACVIKGAGAVDIRADIGLDVEVDLSFATSSGKSTRWKLKRSWPGR